MSRPTIYGFCDAGCKWETVHKPDFDALDRRALQFKKIALEKEWRTVALTEKGVYIVNVQYNNRTRTDVVLVHDLFHETNGSLDSADTDSVSVVKYMAQAKEGETAYEHSGKIVAMISDAKILSVLYFPLGGVLDD